MTELLCIWHKKDLLFCNMDIDVNALHQKERKNKTTCITYMTCKKMKSEYIQKQHSAVIPIIMSFLVRILAKGNQDFF